MWDVEIAAPVQLWKCCGNSLCLGGGGGGEREFSPHHILCIFSLLTMYIVSATLSHHLESEMMKLTVSAIISRCGLVHCCVLCRKTAGRHWPHNQTFWRRHTNNSTIHNFVGSSQSILTITILLRNFGLCKEQNSVMRYWVVAPEFHSSSSTFPILSLGSIIFSEIFACKFFFNSTIEVVTFHLRGLSVIQYVWHNGPCLSPFWFFEVW